MSHEHVSYLNNRIVSNDLADVKTNSFIKLQINYEDYRQGLITEAIVFCSLLDIIRDIFKKFSKQTNLEHISSDNVSLVQFSINNEHIKAPLCNAYMNLKQLNIKSGYILYFKRSIITTSSKRSHLTIYAPNSIDKVEYEWNKDTTTLQILLEYIIERFSLESIERERIHLLTFIHDELDITTHSNTLLTNLNISDLNRIFVEVVPSLSSSMIHVQCIYTNGMEELYVLSTITIEEIKEKIEKTFGVHHLMDFKLFDRTKRELDLSKTNVALHSLGVNAGQTMYASFCLDSFSSKLPISHSLIKRFPRSSSLIAKYQPDDVKIIFQVSPLESITTEASMNDTVDDLIKSIFALRKNLPSTRLKMMCGSISINDNELKRRLTDFGIKRGNIITVSTIPNAPSCNTTAISYADKTYMRIKQSEMSQMSIKPLGLSNLGNTCYMNSALQCLAHTKPLTQFFLNCLSQDISHNDKYIDTDWNPFYTIGIVTGAYADLLRNLWLPDRTIGYLSSFRPSQLKEIIGIKATRFDNWDQQDAQEFLTFLLNEIHKELKENNSNQLNSIIEELFFGKIQSMITCLACQHTEKTINLFSFLPLSLYEQVRKFTVTFITRDGKNEKVCVNVPEHGQVKHLIEAYAQYGICGYLMRTIVVMVNDEQLDLEMPLNQLSTTEVLLVEKDDFASNVQFNRFDRCSKKLNLEDCLREFCSLEHLDDSWSCQQDTCKRNRLAIKQLQFHSLPSILIIQFKRFSHENGFRQKLDTFVDYPIDNLDLSSFLSSSDEMIYDLFAVSKHIGTICSGHYIACARHETNGKSEWFKFDDSYVSSLCYNDDIVSKDAYLLFYIRRENRKQQNEQ